LDLSVDLSAAHLHVRGDADRLRQVFWNAVKFTPAGGNVCVRTSNAPRGSAAQWCVEITDSGIGFGPEVLRKLFRPFEQGDESVPRRFGGMGLGLAICKQIVEQQGGTISASSAGAGHGATFAVALPVEAAPVAAPEPSPCNVEAESRDGEPPEPRPLRVLVVDDHHLTARATAAALRQSGHSVTVATSLREALVAAAAGALGGDRFDLLVSDLHLGDGTGHELMRRLRPTHPDLRGVLITGSDAQGDVASSLAAGFALHLAKPVSLSGLDEAIRRVIAHKMSVEPLMAACWI
jgi:CheY-like chemotaxis protein